MSIGFMRLRLSQVVNERGVRALSNYPQAICHPAQRRSQSVRDDEDIRLPIEYRGTVKQSVTVRVTPRNDRYLILLFISLFRLSLSFRLISQI